MGFIELVVRLLLGAVFFAAAIAKGMALESVSGVFVRVFGMQREEAMFAICALALIELVIASFLVAGYKARFALRISCGLSLFFVLWHVYVSVQEVHDCGCGLSQLFQSVLGLQTNGFLWAIAVLLLSLAAWFLDSVSYVTKENSNGKQDSAV